MVTEHSNRELAVILHADVMGSTALVQRNETIAHERIRDAFRRFAETISAYGGTPHEVRGDALLATFSRASDAVSASLSFQIGNAHHNETLDDDIPEDCHLVCISSDGERRAWGLFDRTYCWTEAYRAITGNDWQHSVTRAESAG